MTRSLGSSKRSNHPRAVIAFAIRERNNNPARRPENGNADEWALVGVGCGAVNR